MSKELTLEYLKLHQEHCKTTVASGDHTDQTSLEEITKAIEWVEKQNQWISVEERLPEKMGHFIVYCPQSFPKNCRSVVAEFYIDGDFKGFYGEACESHLEDATHWCELLPEPF